MNYSSLVSWRIKAHFARALKQGRQQRWDMNRRVAIDVGKACLRMSYHVPWNNNAFTLDIFLITFLFVCYIIKIRDNV